MGTRRGFLGQRFSYGYFFCVTESRQSLSVYRLLAFCTLPIELFTKAICLESAEFVALSALNIPQRGVAASLDTQVLSRS
jgi:hypothetical protein